MPLEYIGQKRKELFEWLKDTWLKSGPPVCFVHGFPGTGKTSLADTLADGSSLSYVRSDSTAPVSTVDDLLLELQESASEAGLPFLEQALFQDSLDASTALVRFLEAPVLLVVHEGQRFLDSKTGEPWPQLISMLQRMARHQGFPGRLLILANQLVNATGKSSEPFEIRRLEGLTLDEGVLVLDNLLKVFGREQAFPPAKRRDIVKCLGCNPRALRTLVGCLESSSLLELIQTNPDAWVPTDNEVSPDLVEKLEEGLVQNRFSRVGSDTLRFIGRLSVHRQSVPVAALDDLAEGRDSTALRRELSNLLWLDHSDAKHSVGKYKLHPVVKEVALHKLKPSDLLNAHSRAADYFLRPFVAREMVGGSELAGSFAEVRYHLLQAHREVELGDIAKRYTEYLKRTYTPTNPVPTDPRVLDDRIGVLSVLLTEPGAKGLEYYLARLLQARGLAGDLEQAVIHAGRATGKGAPVASWVLRVRLEYKVRGFNVAEQTFQKALKKVPAEGDLSSLYQFGAEMFELNGKYKEALARLKEGMNAVKPEQNLSVLYRLAIEIAAKQKDDREVESLAVQGLSALKGGTKGRHLIAEAAFRVFSAHGNAEAIERLIKLRGEKSLDPPESALARYLLVRLSGDWANAVEVARHASREFPQAAILRSHLIDALIANGNLSDAVKIVPEFAADPRFRDNPGPWQYAYVNLLAGKMADARRWAIQFSPDVTSPLDENELLRLWTSARDGMNNPFEQTFPGLFEYRKGRSAQNEMGQDMQEVLLRPKRVLAVATEWASGNGGLSTFNRELCRALAKRGLEVWCYLANTTSEEILQAKMDDSVHLLLAPKESHASVDARLRNSPPLPNGIVPDIVISHDRITGPAGASLVEHHFPESKHVLFIHTSPKQIEWFKEQEGEATATGTSELRRQLQITLAGKASLVACVGPKLYLSAVDDLRVLTPPQEPVEFLPGLEASLRPLAPPVGNNCLVLGRAEDEVLKGLDIAARATAKLLDRGSPGIMPKPVLVIRGAPVGTGDQLREELMALTKVPANHIQVREYDSGSDVVRRDMLSSAVVLLPSRTEGFGLAAFEAIALGIPVLISGESGLADTIQRLAPEMASHCIVPVTADMETDAAAWERQMEYVLRDKPASFARADQLRKKLSAEMSWGKSVCALLAALELKPKPSGQ